MEHIVGIDLGTTNSEIALLENGVPRVIPVEDDPIMPSCVSMDGNGELLVGRQAKNRMVAYPESTILSIKRKMGQSVKVPLGEKELSPEEVSALILKKLKQEAEAYLGAEVRKAVITVPAYFDDAQRKATRNAGLLAGLEVTRIVNEPTAASLAYDANLEDGQQVLVYDLGGGTFDVSLVSVEKGVVEVKSSHGDTQLGGDDFDRLLMEHVAAAFKEETAADLLADPRSRNRLWAAVEKAKRRLSDAPYASIREEFIHGDHHLDLEISRMDYEEMIRPLLKKTMDSVHKCLRDAGALPGDIQKVILVGGATRTPLVRDMINSELGLEARHEISPDLIVAMGAAIQAAVSAGMETRSVLVDITPHTFGTSVVGPYNGRFREGVYAPVIARNSALPVMKGELFGTMVDGQEAVDVRIYQGEHPLVEDNTFIGNFLVEGLSDVPAGNQIVLNLQLDLNGILEVTAVEKSTGLSKTVRMETGKDKPAFDMAAARKNLSALAGLDEGADTAPIPREDEKDELLQAAKQLRKRARQIMDDVDEADAAELSSLLDQSKEAVSGGDMKKLSDLNESLSDMLFYLED